MIKSNFHIHTNLCDGRDSPEDMVRSAISLGFEQLGFSGHMDADCHMEFKPYLDEIHRLWEKYCDRIDILAGVELDTCYDPECANGAEYTIGSTHFLEIDSQTPLAIDLNREQFLKIGRKFFSGDFNLMSKAYYNLLARSYDRLHCDIVGHFDLITKFNDELQCIDEDTPEYYLPALETMEYLCSRDVIFEINCGAWNNGKKRELYPNRFFLRHLHRMNGRIMINTDAHGKEMLAKGTDVALERAKDCGFRTVWIIRHNETGDVKFEEEPMTRFL